MRLPSLPSLLLLVFCASCGGSATDTRSNGDGDANGSSGGTQNAGDGDDAGDGDLMSEIGGTSGGGGNVGGALGAGGHIPDATGGLNGDGGDPGIGGNPGDGGSSTGGASAVGGSSTGGAGDPVHVPIPSPGCALEDADPAPGAVTGYTQISVATPEGYDGSTPGPLLIGLNANGWTLTPMVTVGSSPGTPTELARDFLIARLHRPYPDSWEVADLEEYDAAFEYIAGALCFDESRVFGVGHAAGGRFLTRVIREESPSENVVRPLHFRAIALVGAPLLGDDAPWPEIPILLVHSIDDNAAAPLLGKDGTVALAGIQERMQCEESSAAAGSSSCDEATTNCTDFNSCIAPLRYCAYDQTLYGEDWECLYTVETHRFFTEHL